MTSFEARDLGEAKHYLGIKITRDRGSRDHQTQPGADDYRAGSQVRPFRWEGKECTSQSLNQTQYRGGRANLIKANILTVSLWAVCCT